ncbi:hypothetical protein GCM10022252_65230 [Streptosporangium oxazolinicum]|uniref:Uncharacterized protein n=1 Tax=Streptosporangium oxazolinicum TaxID=909287 RepID=A0ABP8BG25_9ACTN
MASGTGTVCPWGRSPEARAGNHALSHVDECHPGPAKTPIPPPATGLSGSFGPSSSFGLSGSSGPFGPFGPWKCGTAM